MDKLTPERRSKNMAAIRSKGMKPEMVVRRLVHSMGFRYRLHRKDLPGKPDLVFGPRKKAILVHGCFWHQHPDPDCKDGRMPKSRLDYWGPKLERNRLRDLENIQSLNKLGWSVLVVWECETRNLAGLKLRLASFLKPE
ncbi:DNA mismatch endonuclease Vsr [Roseibium denhamense]|uniref:Very short patch repair endonuclease n=1 Tax=Roseibium denhamense TaxID=76305 RepID=A0ABY1NFA4_9HYPH|nr:very short patch repair endonuclease [Roseibium denhamense]MTI04044.1 DNA mismatch endonuclease Vsr [Roseibium denhamense]SMP07607.1 T/G mismatch-specific endonuclease [Roseibium denhamense]